MIWRRTKHIMPSGMGLNGRWGDSKQIGFRQKVMTYNSEQHLLGHFLAEPGVLGEASDLADDSLHALLGLED